MTLNKIQRWILIVGLVIFVLMGLYPPWKAMTSANTANRQETPYRYGLITKPPIRMTGGEFAGQIATRLDTTRLTVQWLILAVATGGAIFLTKDPPKKEDPK